jgi:replicative DNA helicase
MSKTRGQQETCEYAEQAVLGALLLDSKAFGPVRVILDKAEYFEDSTNEMLYDVMLYLADHGKPIDAVTVASEVMKHGVPCLSYISNLTSQAPTSANAEYYAEIVRANWIQSQLNQTARAIHAESAKGKRVDHLATRMLALLEERRQIGVVSCGDLAPDYFHWLTHPPKIGWRLPWASLDRLLPYGVSDEVVVLAARSGDGKTTTALNLSVHVARNYGPVLFCSAETGRFHLMQRLNAILCDEEAFSRTSRNPSAKKQLLCQYKDELARLPVFIEDRFTDIDDVLRAAREHVTRVPHTQLVVMDYLQEFSTDGSARSEMDSLNAILAKIQRFRKDVQRSILLLSQFKKDEFDPRHGPSKGLLRGTGRIENMADVILLQWVTDRPEHENTVPVKIRVAKNRDGPCGTTPPLQFILNQTKIVDPKHEPLRPRQPELEYSADDDADDDVPF